MTFHRFGSPATPANRWYLASLRDSNGVEVDPRPFTQGKPVDCASGLTIAKRQDGYPLDFTLADFDMPVVSSSLATLLQEEAHGCIQLLPAKVEGEEHKYFVLVATCKVACISDSESAVMRWEEKDGRPEKVGDYRMIASPVLTNANHRGEAIFRARGWEIMLLATDSLARKLLASGLTGLELTQLPPVASDA
jgi:hypothetical protein